ncbi:VCBS repeat-containing protein [Cohaesibacter sp. CAU 1516]|uniref:FG-GAP repeat domain-containing protein n=1 Tax=Cohaesibacter sp. CAU 1516 TaxID=2576038 RepID=UPI0010FE756F|nr:VCBS repeat-containing protein [Cohaesibacter sp. CAU 1516]TLP48219.1 VCBS repeat-containing protein [Cohaesibacter sp. CAU 1516]
MRAIIYAISAGVIGVFASHALAVEAPHMVEVTETSGVEHSYNGGWEYFVGGGVAAFDCNGDRYPELYLAGGSDPAALYVNRSTLGGALSFEKKSDSPLAIEAVSGAYPLDIDSDGIQDLLVLRVGENKLFRGLGNCQFEEANKRWSFDGGQAWSTAFAAMWEEGQSLPTLAIGNYVDRDQPGAPFGTCHDTDFFRPSGSDGSGGYRHESLKPGYCALSMMFTDWDRSGKPDLRIANDRQYYRGGHEQLWKVRAGEQPEEYRSGDGWRRVRVWGMGIASTDLTGDGRPDYYITSMADNKLQILTSRRGEPDFEDGAFQRGITAHRPFVGDNVNPSTSWHAQFDDVNNDSFIDLFVTKGNVEAMTDFAMEDPNSLLLGMPDGSFEEAADKANMLSFARGRGGSLVDLNLDGQLDSVVVNRKVNAQIWRNMGQVETKDGATDEAIAAPMGNWVALQLLQDGPNRDAIGSFLEVRIADRTQSREITIGGGHAGGKAGWHHFGIGVAERAVARVQWPDGEWSPWIRLFANQHARITRGKSTADVWLPSQAALQN